MPWVNNFIKADDQDKPVSQTSEGSHCLHSDTSEYYIFTRKNIKF